MIVFSGFNYNILFTAIFGFISFFFIQTAGAQTTFIIDSTGDTGDSDAGDGTCDTGFETCTLRAAIQQANASSDTDTIHFDISGQTPHVIEPTSELPAIRGPIIIDGTSEPDYNGSPVVEINGKNSGGNSDGIRAVHDGKFILRAISITNFSSDGLTVSGAAANEVDALIEESYFGVKADGRTISGNGEYGINIRNGSATIGGDGKGNIISGNLSGIYADNGNKIIDNVIGLNEAGKRSGNRLHGIRIYFSNQVEVRGNKIYYNKYGISIEKSSQESDVVRNEIYYNKKDGIEVPPTDPRPTISEEQKQHNIRKNLIYGNGEMAIDIDNNGRTGNDPGDGDGERYFVDNSYIDGVNKLQNFPEIEGVRLNKNMNKIVVSYFVDSTPNLNEAGSSEYPLKVDFFLADSSAEESDYLGTRTYEASNYGGCGNPPCTDTVTFEPEVEVAIEDRVTATATDNKGNTSEVSPVSSRLPVELINFESKQIDAAAVLLSWRTASEQNNSGFQLQHRFISDENWQEVAFIESKAGGGTTTEPHTYHFTAKNLAVGTHQFRLNQVDLDGSSTLHGPISIEVKMDEPVKLVAPSPNPVSSNATLSFAIKEQVKTTIVLYNTLGQEVATLYQGTPPAGERQTTQIDATGLPSGVYFLRLRAGEKTITQQLTVLR